MRYRLPKLLVVITASLIAASSGLVAAKAKAPAQRAQQAASQQKLPPISYVCPMPGDEDVLMDKPGDCPKCKMTLVPVRLDSRYDCPVHSTQSVSTTPGKCRFDGRDLVPMTLSVFWTCPDDPEKRLLEPGTCANGQPRREGHEVRAHGDHNPRHGGQFFMAQDNWHHLEGTYPQKGLVRFFFYDNFTKPMPVANFQGRVVTQEQWDPNTRTSKELESFPLKPVRVGVMEAQVKNDALPFKVTAKVKFDSKGPENRFDFNFSEYSKEPAAPVAPTTTSTTPRAPQTATNARTALAPAKSAGPSAPATATEIPPQAAPAQSPVPTVPAPGSATTQMETGPAIPPALQAALDESALPQGTPELVAELGRRANEVEQMVKEGNLAQVWLPAMSTKTVALALDSHSSTLPERQRVLAASAVKRIVTSAWELDAYGDLGNKQKMNEAYERLAAAVSDLRTVYEAR